ncbi:MAG: hypothetical protein HKN09_01185 [Saprospiraceae bacterium]|nr:hypothetical protein [Saprospiraceae bacterium]
MDLAKTVEEFISKHDQWHNELELLRSIIKKTELNESLKWGMPTYTIRNKNVVGIAGFKHHFGMWFFQGVFLSDPHKLLINAQEGKTKAMRQLRFDQIEQIDEGIIMSYLEEAIQNAKDGKEVKPEKKPLVIKGLLAQALSTDKTLNEAFNNFTPGKQKEFAEYISSAKREATQISRLEKCIPMIIKGIGLNDKYR